MGDRCTGHCCAVFTLPASPDKLAKRLAHVKDGAFILNMVIFIEETTIGENGKVAGTYASEFTPLRHCSSDTTIYLYTCRHFDREARNCTVYEDRPEMCRDHPGYGQTSACDHVACEWTLKADVTFKVLQRAAHNRAPKKYWEKCTAPQ